MRQRRAQALAEARPAPILSPFHKSGADGVRFDVSHGSEQPDFRLERKGVIAALIDVALANGSSCASQSCRVGSG